MVLWDASQAFNELITGSRSIIARVSTVMKRKHNNHVTLSLYPTTTMNFPPLSTLGITDFEVSPPKDLTATLKKRHPLSDPEEFARKAETQCQYCFKSKADGVTLFKCSGCKTDIYCVSTLACL